MIPSREPRTGTHPVTEDPVAPPESAAPLTNPINGHEHLLSDDLQFACIYPLEVPDPCLNITCECPGAAAGFNPVCQQDDGTYAQLQRFGRATPGTRQLELVRALPSRSALASICTAPVFEPANPAFAYRPAVDAMLRTLRKSLVKP